MKDLIERLEKAMGPDRELDGAIFCACVPRMAECWPHWSKQERLNMPPRYTSSIDAALTLVPTIDGERLDWLVGFDDDVAIADVSRPHDERKFQPGSMPAIALCIAALKARAIPPNSGSDEAR